MQSLSEKQALRDAVAMLESLGTANGDRTPRKVDLRPLKKGQSIDGLAKVGPHTFAMEWKSSGAAGPIAAALEQLQRYAREAKGRAIPLIVVPYMGEVGRERCEEAGVSWLDLSGNARIVAPGLHVVIEGKPNRFKRRGRPSSVFAPQASRITRWLLMHPGQPLTQRELAQATHMDAGYTSRIVAKLESDGLLVRDREGVRPRDPDTLLDAWREAYQFSRHEILAGHIAARSGDELLRRLAHVLSERNLLYAATGLGAAWLYTHFAGFRLVTVFVEDRLPPSLLQDLSFRAEPRGANVWLVVPYDEGVFQGVSERDAVQCVHPVQGYLDLKGHPERSEEAAAELRSRLLSWGADGG